MLSIVRFPLLLVLLSVASAARASYWLEDIKHQGIASFNPNPESYQVFRNVKDFGAKGDGVTDDTEAINLAISAGDRCGGAELSCVGSTTTPAIVYFPSGTYKISDSVVSYYYTQMLGDPTDPPVLSALPHFPNAALVDANPVNATGTLRYGATNTFFRQVRNFVLDMTDVRGSVLGLHWTVSQATTLQNLVFRMSRDAMAGQTGMRIAEGSGGFLGDLVFEGGKVGASFGNQQFTSRNLTFRGSETAIEQTWDWGWTYKDVHVFDAKVGINCKDNMTASVSLVDSSFTNVETAILSYRNTATQMYPSTGSLTLDNVDYSGVGVLLQGPYGWPLLPGGTGTVRSYVYGNSYVPEGAFPAAMENLWAGPRPSALVTADDNNKYYSKPKPTYANTTAASMLSARDYGAAGDGFTDDTAALNTLFAHASAAFYTGAIAFLDAGAYLVTDTVRVPANIRIVGEPLAAIILAYGPGFGDMDHPRAVVQVGRPGDAGRVEMSDVIVSGKGGTAGAVFIEYNLSTGEDAEPSGLWDVHVRVGGFTGSELGIDRCPTTEETGDQVTEVDPACIVGYMSFHIGRAAEKVYVENSWVWTADHDIDDPDNTRVSIYNARGLYVASARGPVWIVGSGVEHHTLYNYMLSNTQNVWLGQIQSETPYYQPNPPAPFPFVKPARATYDPPFAADCPNSNTSQPVLEGAPTYPDESYYPSPPPPPPPADHQPDARRRDTAELDITTASNSTEADPIPCAMAWGLVVLGSQHVRIVGGGLYSFFNDYSTKCSDPASGDEGERCQERIFHVGETPSVPPGATDDVEVYGLATVGVKHMISRGKEDLAPFELNRAGFSDGLAFFKY